MAPMDRLSSLQEAAVVALQEANRDLPVVVLNKVLFYWDLLSYLETGQTITGAAYIALHEGPVVAKYDKRLLAPLEEMGFIRWEQRGSMKPVVLQDKGQQARLGVGERQLLRQVLDHIGQLKSTRASDYSHKNPGWCVAYQAGLKQKGSPKPIDLDLAIQQLVADDPWLEEPLTEAEQRRFQEDIAGPDHPWD